MPGLVAACGLLALEHYGMGIHLHASVRGLNSATAVELMVAESLAAAWIAACWYARWLWNVRPSRSPSSESQVAAGTDTMHRDA